MKAALTFICGLLSLPGSGQGILPPAAFEWDAPITMADVTGYRLEWGPQNTVDLPIYQAFYAVENFPTGLLLPVSVYSLGSNTNSEPTTIFVYNVSVNIEESENLTNWQTIGSVLIRGQRKPTSFLRLNLQPSL